MSVDIRPRQDFILIERQPFDDEVTEGGIIIPENVKEKEDRTLCTAVVLEVGPGRINDDGYLVEHDLEPGDAVLVARWSGYFVKMPSRAMGEGHGGVALLREKDILAKLTPAAVVEADLGDLQALGEVQ